MNGPVLIVHFRSRGRSQREWSASFYCGSHEANQLQALKVAWDMNASIVSSEEY